MFHHLTEILAPQFNTGEIGWGKAEEGGRQVSVSEEQQHASETIPNSTATYKDWSAHRMEAITEFEKKKNLNVEFNEGFNLI